MDAAILPLAAALMLEQVAITTEASPHAALADTNTDFHLSLSLEAWLPRLAGDFTDGPAKVDASVVDLHDQEMTFAGTLNLTRDRLNVSLRGFAFSTDGGGVATDSFTLGGVTVSSGDDFNSDFSWWSAGAEIAYDFYRPLAQQPTRWSDARSDWTAPTNGTDFSVLALVSADVESVSRSISDSTTGISSKAIEAFAAIDVGIGFRLAFDTKDSFPIIRRVDLNTKVAVGVTVPFGDGDYGSATRVEAMLSAWFCHEGSVYFGYRLVGGSLDGDEVGFDGSLQGLRAGFTLAF